jgi:hypothetical protein
VVAERDFGNPHRTKQMRPLGGIGLLECSIRVGAKDAGLITISTYDQVISKLRHLLVLPAHKVDTCGTTIVLLG